MVRYFKTEFIISGHGCLVHLWTGILENAHGFFSVLGFFFSWRGSRVIVSSSKESRPKNGYGQLCSYIFVGTSALNKKIRITIDLEK
jgi:hypothetical protein